MELVPMSIAARRGSVAGLAAGFVGAMGAAGCAPVVAVAVTSQSRGEEYVVRVRRYSTLGGGSRKAAIVTIVHRAWLAERHVVWRHPSLNNLHAASGIGHQPDSHARPIR